MVEARPNSPATGQPTIAGTAEVGKTLTANTTSIADEDGLANTTFSYQWVSNDSSADSDISGATDDTYTLVDADEGKTLKVTVSFTDDRGHEETLTSSATAEVEARPNSPATGVPTISGTAEVAEILTADTSGIADEDGLTNAVFSYQWVSNDGSADADISGATDSTYTLTFAESGKTIKVRVSFTDEGGHEETLPSAPTDAVTALSKQQAPDSTDTTAPTITSIAITSMAGGVYGIDDTIQVTVTFSEEVVVDGTPSLELSLGDVSRLAQYQSVEDDLVAFSYTVAEGDPETDGIAVGASTLTLNGGSIKDAADNSANLSHDIMASQSDHRVDGIRPRLLRVCIPSSSYNSDGVFQIGEEVIIFADFSEPIFGSRWSATAPQLTLDFDGEERLATWATTGFGDFFSYYVQEGDSDADGIAIAANAVVLNGGFFRDAAGNNATDLDHPAVAANPSNKVDAAIPYITSNPGIDGSYSTGSKIEVTVSFSENVWVPDVWTASGSPKPELELDVGGEARTATFQSYQSNRIVFVYSVQPGDIDDNGVSIGADKLSLNGGVIWDEAGYNPVSAELNLAELPVDAVVSHEAMTDNPGHKVNGETSALAPVGNTTIRLKKNRSHVASYSVPNSDPAVTWSLSGDDGDQFPIQKSSGDLQMGILTFRSPPNHDSFVERPVRDGPWSARVSGREAPRAVGC